MDKFLDSAIEIDVDALCDGREVIIGGVMEPHRGGWNSLGDSAAPSPPYSISRETMEEIKRQTRLMALELEVKGS